MPKPKLQDALTDEDFALPKARRYPIHNAEAAELAIERVRQHGTPHEIKQVIDAVANRYPDLVGNEEPVTNAQGGDEGEGAQAEIVCNSLQSITTNVTPSIRHEILEGRNYMVVPMVMITNGVHAGSNGPLYYPNEELAKTPAVWDHKPVVVYHPTMNGQAISACQPAVISRRKVGLILNTTYEPARRGEPGKLKAEAWLETNRLQEVDPRVLTAIKKGQPVEVSTGLFTDNENKAGVWNGEQYNAVARNYRPDHLAILPDQKGSCSLEDGAGLLKNSAQKQEKAMPKKAKIVDALIANADSPWEESDRELLMKLDTVKLNALQGDVADSGSDNNDQVKDAPGQVKPKKPKGQTCEAMNEANDLKGGGEETEDEEEANENDAEGKATNNAAQTVDQFINNAPAEFRDVLRSGYKAHQAQKVALIGQITTNKANRFSQDYLATKDLEELQAIAALAGGTSKPTTNRFIGQGEDAGAGGSDAGEQEALPVPTINFEKKQ